MYMPCRSNNTLGTGTTKTELSMTKTKYESKRLNDFSDIMHKDKPPLPIG